MMERVLIVAYEESATGDIPCLTVCRRASGDRLFGINSFWGTEAEQLYRKLTKQEGPFNTVAIGTATEENHWLRDLLSKPAKEYEKVDGLDSGSADKVNTVPDDGA